MPIASVQAFLNQPLRMIVGFASGGAADVMARIIAKGLGTQLGQQVMMDNKPGAEGIIASQELIKSVPDGYTLMMGTNTATVAVPALRSPSPYAPFKVLTPLSWASASSPSRLGQASLVRLACQRTSQKK